MLGHVPSHNVKFSYPVEHENDGVDGLAGVEGGDTVGDEETVEKDGRLGQHTALGRVLEEFVGVHCKEKTVKHKLTTIFLVF
jgi:hypothetical protein